MAKERMLTVLVPIKDSDATVVASLPAVTPDNINVIYKHEGVYKRIWLNPATNQYEYHEVIDREFPYLGKPLEIFDFTYDATRMGSAPTITAQGVMWYADKDENNNDVTLEDLWLARNNDCHVTFNGENFYLKQVPTSSKGNDDARYKYDIDFVSERIVLENVYIYDVVQPFVTERPISESAQFSFFGDVSELVKRINASLLRSGLAKLELRDGVTSYLTYEQFNSLGDGTFPFPPEWSYSQRVQYRNAIYVQNGGNYNRYLQTMVYKVVDGEFVQSGYICRIGKDKKGELTTSEEKLITFDNNSIHEALQQVHDIFELQYYIYSEKNSDGDFTGNTIIMIADCEHDFADVTGTDADGNPIYSRDADGIPTTEHPFDYGVDNELLFKEKTNTTDKIITRITGIGSEENIPWYYPNPTADGWIKPVYKRKGVVQDIEVDYPLTEGDTPEENVRYEKYLKNRIGNSLRYGIIKKINTEADYQSNYVSNGFFSEDSVVKGVTVSYVVSTKTNVINPKLTMDLLCPEDSNCNRIVARLYEAPDTLVDSYDSNATYATPTDFQKMFITRDGGDYVQLTTNKIYYIYIYYYLSSIPASRVFDKSGYFYPAQTITDNTHQDYTGQDYFHNYSQFPGKAYIGQNFYAQEELIPYTVWLDSQQNIEYRQGTAYHHVVCVDAGYSSDGTSEHSVSPIVRVKDFKYKDLASGVIYKCNTSNAANVTNGNNQTAFSANPQMDWEEWVKTFIQMKLCVYESNDWYIGSRKIMLVDYGMSITNEPNIYDTIEFQRVKYITPQPNLMPEVYIKTDGERRFYNAVNYPLSGGTPDPMIGEEESGGQIINPIYYKEDSTTHFDFENEYIQSRPHEHIENFDDVKPTIKGQVNTVDGRTFRIDVVEEFAYDQTDNDEVWESNENGNVSGEYKHPYFFAKLRPLGFNLFDLALQDDMVLSMTTGNCGACNFKIGVDENTKKNPVQVWEYDVYEGSDWDTKVFKYHAGDLRRIVDTSNLYYDKDGTIEGYVRVDLAYARSGFLIDADRLNLETRMFQRLNYTADMVINGEVGSLRMDGRNHFEGDVKTNGRFIDSQQDTSENYVWVALMKDTDTYGVIMPAARPDYADGNLSVYIRPKSVADTSDEDTADKFVLTNIRMPQVYLRRAEKELSKRLVAYMYDNNYQKFNFSINFSRIFLAQNPSDEAFLNENSVLYVSFNNRTYRQYVKHYSYKMTKDAVLPEIDVDMNEELSVSRTQREREDMSLVQIETANARRLRTAILRTESRIGRQTIGRNEDAIVNGNLVSRDGTTSFGELSSGSRQNATRISDTSIELEVNHFKKDDFVIGNNKLSIGESITVPTKDVFDTFVGNVNTFNVAVANRIMQVRYTMEDRLGVIQSGRCTDISQPMDERIYDFKDNAGIAFWKDKDGENVDTTGECPAPFNISWTEFDVNSNNT